MPKYLTLCYSGSRVFVLVPGVGRFNRYSIFQSNWSKALRRGGYEATVREHGGMPQLVFR